MATLQSTVINDTGYLTLPNGTAANRPTITVTTSTGRALGISVNGLQLYIPTAWATYTNLPLYLTGLVTTTYINDTDAGTFTITVPSRVYLLRNPAWGGVDLTGYTLLESGMSYMDSAPSLTSVYYRDYQPGTYALDNLSAMYMFAPIGMTRYNTLTADIETHNGAAWIRKESIPESGLVCNLDATKYVSGTTWYDTSGSGNNGTLVNSPTWTGNSFLFNGSSSYITIAGNYATGTWTVIGASRYSGDIRGRVISSVNNNWLMGHHGTYVGGLYSEGWVITNPYYGDTIWRIFASSGSSAGDSWQMYVNGLQTASNANGSAGPNVIELGGYSNTGEMSTGEVGFILVYNRVLTADEIQQIYVAKRSRFGL